MARTPTVADWLAALPAGHRAAIEARRAVVRRAAPALPETIKWNAPSFGDRVTLGLGKDSGVRIVLHRGAAPSDKAFVFADDAGLAAWPAPDRGVVQFADAAQVEARAGDLEALIARWVAATT